MIESCGKRRYIIRNKSSVLALAAKNCFAAHIKAVYIAPRSPTYDQASLSWWETRREQHLTTFACPSALESAPLMPGVTCMHVVHVVMGVSIAQPDVTWSSAKSSSFRSPLVFLQFMLKIRDSESTCTRHKRTAPEAHKLGGPCKFFGR